jgi:hypothetical protein
VADQRLSRDQDPLLHAGKHDLTDVERQILLNLIAIMEALAPLAPSGKESTRELLRQRYGETAKLIREAGPAR